MTRKEAHIRLIAKREELMHKYMFEEAEVLTMAIEALKEQEFDEVVFDADEFCLIVDKDKIYVFRRGRNKVKVERPVSNIPERTDFYGL